MFFVILKYLPKQQSIYACFCLFLSFMVVKSMMYFLIVPGIWTHVVEAIFNAQHLSHCTINVKLYLYV